MVIYRPPGPYSQFLEEFDEFIADIATRPDKILIIVLLYFHLNKPSYPISKAFLALCHISGFIHLVHEPTHSSGITLDLILSHGLDVSTLNVTSVSSAGQTTFLSHLKLHYPVLALVAQIFYFPSYQLCNHSDTMKNCLGSWIILQQ